VGEGCTGGYASPRTISINIKCKHLKATLFKIKTKYIQVTNLYEKRKNI